MKKATLQKIENRGIGISFINTSPTDQLNKINILNIGCSATELEEDKNYSIKDISFKDGRTLIDICSEDTDIPIYKDIEKLIINQIIVGIVENTNDHIKLLGLFIANLNIILDELDIDDPRILFWEDFIYYINIELANGKNHLQISKYFDMVRNNNEKIISLMDDVLANRRRCANLSYNIFKSEIRDQIDTDGKGWYIYITNLQYRDGFRFNLTSNPNHSNKLYFSKRYIERPKNIDDIIFINDISRLVSKDLYNVIEKEIEDNKYILFEREILEKEDRMIIVYKVGDDVAFIIIITDDEEMVIV